MPNRLVRTPELLIIGIVDDLVLVPFAIRWLLNRLPPEIAHAAATAARTGRSARS